MATYQALGAEGPRPTARRDEREGRQSCSRIALAVVLAVDGRLRPSTRLARVVRRWRSGPSGVTTA